MGINFDKDLLALADCPVLPEDEGGSVVFDPYPVVTACDDLILAHEICHVLAGRRNYAIFNTAILARSNYSSMHLSVFKSVLNLLFDWYDEKMYRDYSPYLDTKIDRLKKRTEPPSTGSKLLMKLHLLYTQDILPKDMPAVRSVLDLVLYADKICKDAASLSKEELRVLQMHISGLGSGGDIGRPPKKCSTYYQNAVARYYDIIKSLAEMWKRNKIGWIVSYYGEINWKDLVGMMLGSELSLPVFRLLSKIFVARSVYLVIDRSGSTSNISSVIMDTAIIITESLRMLEVPISILEVGSQNKVINDIDTDVPLDWFVPASDGGTPLGEVCNEIRGADHDSYVLIVTDGMPNNMDTLVSFIRRFPGHVLTFVIGQDAFATYSSCIKNTVLVEPNTIIREMMNEDSLT